jgi:abortive infection bacteriophage resistance protein
LPQKSTIANEFGFNTHSDFSSYLEAITIIRNVIAHHSRLWNNTITTKYSWPTNLKNSPLNNSPTNEEKAKLFPLLSLTLYILKNISANNDVKVNMYVLLQNYPTVPLYKMGFPANWETQPIWKV